MVRFVIFLFILIFSLPLYAEVKDYKVFFAELTSKDFSGIAVREFTQEGLRFYLSLDLDTLETKVIPADSVTSKAATFDQIVEKYKNTDYVRILELSRTNSTRMMNSGLNSFKSSAMFLTVDLCPSRRELEYRLFDNLSELSGSIKAPVPVALCFTGGWLKSHKSGIAYLKKLSDERKIVILPVNHSNSHFYSKDLPFEKNFLLAESVNVDSEVLDCEIRMIEAGFSPSIFFRFPGLISDKKLFEKILSFGLIPIGSDSWLAKFQKPKEGSIILVHGNGNEPEGIDAFLLFYKENADSFKSGKLFFSDLRRALSK